MQDASCSYELPTMSIAVSAQGLPQLAPSLSSTFNLLGNLCEAMSTGQPVSPGCGAKLAALKTHVLRMIWQEWEHVKWSWHSDTLAFWTLCVDCHMVVWPLDRRYNSAHSRPFNGDGRGALGVRSGEFYLTAPPPEYMHRSFSESALAIQASVLSPAPSLASSGSPPQALKPYCTQLGAIEYRKFSIFYYHSCNRI